MAEITLESLTKVYPDGTRAVTDLDLEMGAASSSSSSARPGCGKTTALRMIAGLETISCGQVVIDGQVVNDLPPKDRDIAMVFQNYALYPHMTVAREHRLRAARCAKAAADARSTARVSEAARAARPHRHAAQRKPRHALRRPAPARRDGARDRPRAAGVPDGRAALEPRREAARRDARRDRPHPARARRDDDLRHPRPDRGDDAWATGSR